jgi:hypothetical protein
MNSAQELLKGDSTVLTKQTPVSPNRLNFWSSWRIFTKCGTTTTTTNKNLLELSPTITKAAIRLTTGYHSSNPPH